MLQQRILNNQESIFRRISLVSRLKGGNFEALSLFEGTPQSTVLMLQMTASGILGQTLISHLLTAVDFTRLYAPNCRVSVVLCSEIPVVDWFVCQCLCFPEIIVAHAYFKTRSHWTCSLCNGV